MGLFRHGFVVLFASAAVLLTARAGDAEAPATLSLGDVSSEVVREDVDLGAMLRASFERELGGVDLRRAAPRQVRLSASLVRMDTEASLKKASVTCVVSALLIDVKRGTVVAIVEGRARAENETIAKSLERAALAGAVRSALARVPEALQ